MRVRLKGLNKVTKRLADGRTVTYHYAWKGGPALPGKPGSAEFVAAYNEAVAKRTAAPDGVLLKVLRDYQSSSNFDGLGERSKKDYVRQIKRIEAEFSDFPLAALADRRTRGEFMAWRDRLAKSSRRQADYAYAVLALILAWSFDRGLVLSNPCERAGKVYRSKRVENVWTADDEAAFMAKAPAHLRLAFMLALWTGQRQGDLLRLPWSAYDGQRIRLKQGKTGARVSVPIGASLKILLDATKKRAVTILTTEAGTAWTESGFRASWRTAVKKAGVVGVTFHDLRGTAVTRLALADCSEAEIATITGHSLKDVGAILDAHYLRRDSGLGVSAIRKREAHEAGTKTPN
ncbi:tyrosine-type recombinase/integrase [Hansschlegelia plantiphila]|uniref:Integrase n=1 Tax=Hansschlegelia plantiphila TaxID=374655 RepID=A0A9W6MUM6_9HYPH|nr:tyrosine-type recombinase/integrase [Hansschlegelia plantiphila]GLK67048.1 integrase [Hansschlegelia plantiphila]